VSPRIEPQLSDIYLDVVSRISDNSLSDSTNTKSIINNPNGKIIIHPFAAWNEKEWGFRNYFNLILELKNNYSVALLTPSNSISIDIQQELTKTNIELIQTNSVNELIDEIKNCSVLIGNDSGPINIGNYINVPTFTIYGATNSAYTTTGYVHHKHIQNSLKCSARENEKFCLIGGATYDCPGIQCMNLLTFNEVYSELILLIEEYCEKEVRIKQ
jgi:heptosyltransferase-2